jgi:hypothetical protein
MEGCVGRRAVVHASGHPDIRATHPKTLEITGEETITTRATCVVGVSARWDPVALGLLRGLVRVTVAAGGRSAEGTAVINPSHLVDGRFVVRRSDDRSDPDTLAVRSTLVSDQLDPALVAALADPATEVTVTLEEIGDRPPLVLLAAAAPPGRPGLLWQHADARVDLSAPVALHVAFEAAPVVAATLTGGPEALPAAALGWLAAAARGGARFLVPDAAGPLLEPLLAAGLPPIPALWLGRVDRRAARRHGIADLLRSAPVPVVLSVPTGEAVLAGDTPVAVDDGIPDVGIGMTWTTAGKARYPDDWTTVVLPARDGDGPRADLDAVVRALAAAGVPPRTVSEALAPLGLSRRRAYDALSHPARPSHPSDGGRP